MQRVENITWKPPAKRGTLPKPISAGDHLEQVGEISPGSAGDEPKAKPAKSGKKPTKYKKIKDEKIIELVEKVKENLKKWDTPTAKKVLKALNYPDLEIEFDDKLSETTAGVTDNDGKIRLNPKVKDDKALETVIAHEGVHKAHREKDKANGVERVPFTQPYDLEEEAEASSFDYDYSAQTGRITSSKIGKMNHVAENLKINRDSMDVAGGPDDNNSYQALDPGNTAKYQNMVKDICKANGWK